MTAYSEVDTILAAVWVAFLPISLMLVMFTWLVVAADRGRTVHTVVTSALLGRLGHCGVAVLLAALTTLEDWKWQRLNCDVLVWAWMTFWVGDVLTTFFYLVYYSFTLGTRSDCGKVCVPIMVLLIWVSALILGAVNVFIGWWFENYIEEDKICVVGFSYGAIEEIKLAAVLIHIVGPLFCFVLMVTVIAEDSALKAKHKKICRKIPRNNPKQLANGVVPPKLPNGIKCESWEVSYKKCYYNEKVRGVRNVLVSLAACTIILNCLPQLGVYGFHYMMKSPYEYTHHILLSAGLLHGIILPIAICRSSHRYRRLSQNMLRRICCKGYRGETRPIIQRIEANPHTTHSGRSSIEEVDSGPGTSQSSHTLDLDDYEVVDIPDITVTESTTDGEDHKHRRQSVIDVEKYTILHRNSLPVEDEALSYHGNEDVVEVVIETNPSIPVPPPPPPLPQHLREDNEIKVEQTENQDSLKPATVILLGRSHSSITTSQPNGSLRHQPVVRSPSTVIPVKEDTGPDVQWDTAVYKSANKSGRELNQSDQIMTELGKKKKGDDTYISSDYHHEHIDDVSDPGGGMTRSGESTGSFDSNSEGWSNLYDDYDSECDEVWYGDTESNTGSATLKPGNGGRARRKSSVASARNIKGQRRKSSVGSVSKITVDDKIKRKKGHKRRESKTLETGLGSMISTAMVFASSNRVTVIENTEYDPNKLKDPVENNSKDDHDASQSKHAHIPVPPPPPPLSNAGNKIPPAPPPPPLPGHVHTDPPTPPVPPFSPTPPPIAPTSAKKTVTFSGAQRIPTPPPPPPLPSQKPSQPPQIPVAPPPPPLPQPSGGIPQAPPPPPLPPTSNRPGTEVKGPRTVPHRPKTLQNEQITNGGINETTFDVPYHHTNPFLQDLQSNEKEQTTYTGSSFMEELQRAQHRRQSPDKTQSPLSPNNPFNVDAANPFHRS